MNFVVTIDPDKEDQVTQLLEALLELGVIEAFSPFTQQKPAPAFDAATTVARPEPVSAFDLAEQYRDLVD
ncbi:MAG: hypothetical protein KIPDCIKN_03927 [Haliscomenobacter sp.]|jgi:hypothetical protein|nr:hypothetical protein [Haliscomenobacter sp.]